MFIFALRSHAVINKFAGLSYLVISQIKHLLLSTWSLTDFAHLLVVWASFVNNEIKSYQDEIIETWGFTV